MRSARIAAAASSSNWAHTAVVDSLNRRRTSCRRRPGGSTSSTRNHRNPAEVHQQPRVAFVLDQPVELLADTADRLLIVEDLSVLEAHHGRAPDRRHPQPRLGTCTGWVIHDLHTTVGCGDDWQDDSGVCTLGSSVLLTHIPLPSGPRCLAGVSPPRAPSGRGRP